MTKKIFFTCFVLAIVVNSIGQTILFDAGWRFHRGGAQSAEMTWFDDSKWRTVDLPHDCYQLPQRKAWQGRCLVIVKSSLNAGNVTLTAFADGLSSSKVVITSVK